jgi:hypothetical protein
VRNRNKSRRKQKESIWKNIYCITTKEHKIEVGVDERILRGKENWSLLHIYI